MTWHQHGGKTPFIDSPEGEDGTVGKLGTPDTTHNLTPSQDYMTFGR